MISTYLKPNVKFLFLSALFACVFSAPAIAGWQLEWVDAFDGNRVNKDNWTSQTKANFNNEVQCYTDDDTSDEKNYDVSDGVLKIIARKKTNQCLTRDGVRTKTWTSGRINSKDKKEFLYGRIEARIRFNELKGGTWPAFWMLENRIREQPLKGDNDFINWPNQGAGEIDVWEWYSHASGSYITNFFNEKRYSSEDCGIEVRYAYPGGASDVLNWHDYAMEWDENNISFHIDGVKVTSHDVSNCPQYKEPMFVLLNVAMGGSLGGSIDPSLTSAMMEVDYIAHCSKTTTNSRERCYDEDLSNSVDPNNGPEENGDLHIFKNTEKQNWVAWDCCGGTNPSITVDNDSSYGGVMQFKITNTTVVGFNSRAPHASNGVPFNASTADFDNGVISFDMKVLAEPSSSANVDWKFKVESDGNASHAEVSLSSSKEGKSPSLNTWQRYTFTLTDLKELGLDLAKIDLVMVYPEWGKGAGAEFRIDNMKILQVEESIVVPETPASNSGGGVLNIFYLFAFWAVFVLRKRKR